MRSRHAARADPPAAVQAVPAVLPEVVITVDANGRARISVDGVAHDRASAASVGRPELGRVLAEIAERAGSPVRVEIHEPDGVRYADILQPRPTNPPGSGQEPGGRGHATGPAAVLGEGFRPGETVLVALIAVTMLADRRGTVRLPNPPKVPRNAADVLLLGTTSGTILRRGVSPRSARRRR